MNESANSTRIEAPSVSEKQGAGEDVVLKLGHIPVLPVLQVLRFEDDVVVQDDAHSAGHPPGLGDVCALRPERYECIPQPAAHHDAEPGKDHPVDLEVGAGLQVELPRIEDVAARSPAFEELGFDREGHRAVLEVGAREPDETVAAAVAILRAELARAAELERVSLEVARHR